MSKSATNFRLKAALAAGVALSPFLVAAPAFAQGGDAASGDAASRDVIVVSARRREESLQDVPIAVTAYSGDELQAAGAVDLTALQLTTPNTTLEVSRGSNSTITPFIRGVGQQDPVAGFEQGVGLYIDDVYLNRPQGAVLEIYDVERIEVLRGPQGTLYGRNTIGGAIKYVTRRLNPDEPELRLLARGGSYAQADVIGTVSLPVTDTLRVGGSVGYFHRNGFGDNLVLDGVENYNKEILAGRFSVEFEPNENFFFRIAGDYLNDDSDPRQGHRLIEGQFTPGAFPVLDDVFDTRAGLNEPRQEVETRGISGLAEWYVTDEITIKNILAYRDGESNSPIDFDSLPVADLDVPVRYEDDQLSEEFQVIYEGDRLQGLVGFYYLDARAFNIFESILGTLTALDSPPLTGLRIGDVDTKTWAVFGDFTYSLTDQLSISFGGRYTEDERTALVVDQLFAGEGTGLLTGEPGILLRTDTNRTFNETFTDFSPRASITWEPNEDLTLYASYSQGFKGGGFDPRGDVIQVPDANNDGVIDDMEIDEFIGFEPEEVDTYEFGVKKSLWNNRYTSNFAFFYSDYTNVQIPGSVGVDADGDGIAEDFAGVTTNAAEARIFGVEYEGNALLYEAADGGALSSRWSLGWIDAEYQEFIGPDGSDVSDERFFQNTPEWTASLFATWSQPVGIGRHDGDLALTSGFSYRSLTRNFEVATPLDQPEYVLVDASLVWTSNDGRWQVGVHGKNLTDKEYIVAGYDFFTIPPFLGLEGTLTAFYGNPRQIFGTVGVQF
ncbi:MAG: TonB-dependent receptor [Pseudomonadota bacterium]